MKDVPGAYVELVVIKLKFKKDLEGYKAQARKKFRKIASYLAQGNGEMAEAYRDEIADLRKKAREVHGKIVWIHQMQRLLRKSA